ncbi:inverse autotransporter beta domain-containing protein [Dendrosporobacter sp. 1207_IL3150]|uniref:inverse autotransporter beta domain-containing protein n=1 Tax=Dendrosporobacter sp. 1207_IL3150 TaxID=3084054 RepID=UPI002FDA2664
MFKVRNLSLAAIVLIGILTPDFSLASGEKLMDKPLYEFNLQKEVQPPDYQFLNELSDEARVQYTINSYISNYFQKAKNTSWFKDVDLAVILAEEYQPAVTVNTLRTIEEDDNSIHFFQGRYQHYGDSSLANLGFGNRIFVDAKKESMVGFNVFFDHTPEHSHSRVGLGLEYFKYGAEYRVNFYLPLSGEKKVNMNQNPVHVYEKTVSGVDFKIGTALPKAPWFVVTATGFKFENNNPGDEYGYHVSSRLQLTPRFNIEVINRNSNQNHDLYGQFLYTIAEPSTPSLWGKPKKIPTDLTAFRRQAVQREYSVKRITLMEEKGF